MRREFRAAVKAAGISWHLDPRELRHTFVSLMSDSGVPVEEIARLAGHANSRTTERVYRHLLEPILEKGTEAIDELFGRPADQLNMRSCGPVSDGNVLVSVAERVSA